MLLQIAHKRSLAFTSRRAEARAAASFSLARRIGKASRCALLLPIPGSFLSSSISRVIGSADLDIGKPIGSSGDRAIGHLKLKMHLSLNFGRTMVGCPDHPIALQNASESAEHSTDTRLHRLINLAAGFVQRGHYQVLQHLYIAGFYRLGSDLDGDYLLAAVHFYRHRRAPGG